MQVQQLNRKRTTPLEDGDGNEEPKAGVQQRSEGAVDGGETVELARILSNERQVAEERKDELDYEDIGMDDQETVDDNPDYTEESKEKGRKEEDSSSNTTKNSTNARGLHKSTRLRGYITLTLASFIHYDAADHSSGGDFAHVSVVPSTPDQRRYAVAASLVSLLLSAACLLVHLDRITPLRRIWSVAFGPGSRWEGALLIFLTIWWTVATGVDTSISGIAGDGRGQFSLYYSTWVCCFTCYWMMERWLVAAGFSSLKSFIASWPNRSPAWICTAVLCLATLVWYLDLWRNHVHLQRDEEQLIVQHLGRVSNNQWRWLVFITICTLIPSVVFALAELVRGSNADGSIKKKSSTETVIEGVAFCIITVAWIPTVIMATTPRGAASLIGNSYFFTWAMAIVVVEGLVWFIHDKRQETYRALREKQREYKRRQDRVAARTEAILAEREEQDMSTEILRRERTLSSDLFDLRAFRSAFSF